MDEKTGRCAILFPHGVLFRDEEEEMRKKLMEIDVLDCVIGLGPNLFYNASMEACIVICNNAKPDSHKGHVLFIDAKDEITRKNAESFLEENHIKKIVSAYNEYTNLEGFSQRVSIDIIKEKGSLLSIQAYVKSQNAIKVEPFSVSFNKWKLSNAVMRDEIEKLSKMFD